MEIFEPTFCLAFAAALLFRVAAHVEFLVSRRRFWGLAPGAGLLLALLGVGFGFLPSFALAIAIPCHFIYFRLLEPLAEVKHKPRLAGFVLIVLVCEPWIVDGWESLFVKAALAQVYLSAGIEKLRQSGWSWTDGRALQAYLIREGLLTDSKAALRLAQRPGSCRFLSLLTLLFELTFWIVILAPPEIALIYVFAGLIFHATVGWLMRIPYLVFFGANYLIFLPDLAEICSRI
ncbi:MAG: hypothetical protein AAF585_27860 [Verrucomicrobiota bacterium]